MNCENCETDKKRGGYNVKKEEVAGLPEGLTNSTVNVLFYRARSIGDDEILWRGKPLLCHERMVRWVYV